MDWSNVLATALPVIVLVGGTLLKTHSKVSKAVDIVESILAEIEREKNAPPAPRTPGV